MNWTGTPVAVTGAGGFIGSHLCEALVRSGARVRALVHYNSLGSYGWLDHAPLREDMDILAGDIGDSDCLETALRGAEVVFHLAALISIPYSYQAPSAFVQTNIGGALNVLQAARRLGTARLVHTSTSEVYGTAREIPMSEDHPLQAQSPYAATKIGADQLVMSWHRSFDVPAVIVRPFNTFGPRQSSRAVIPAIISQCLAGAREIRLGSLTPLRDMNYVDNTVDGFLAAGSAAGAIGETIHLGSGREIRIGDLAGMIARLAGVEVDIRSDEQRLRPERSEVNRLQADARRARDLLGWIPRVSLEDGLARTIEWMRRHAQYYRPQEYVV